jgi:prepilin-type N-terminal cleavage/methylation domain-containing protein
MALRSLPISRWRLIHSPDQNSGFTLIELLLVAVLGSIVLLGAAFFAVSGIRSTAGLRIAQRYQTGFGRLSHLIETEVSEATAIDYPEGAGVCAPGDVEFSLTIPVLIRDEAAAEPVESIVEYYQVANAQGGDDLWRCGPAVDVDGTLIAGTNRAGVLLTNAELNIQRNAATEDFEFEYSVRMTDANNVTAVFDSSVDPGWLRVRTRPFQISS